MNKRMSILFTCLNILPTLLIGVECRDKRQESEKKTTIFNVASEAPKNTLSLDSVLAKALENRTRLNELRFQVLVERDLQKVAISGYLPQLSLDTEAQQASAPEVPHHQTRFEFKQLFFSFAGPLEQHKIAKQTRRIAEGEYRKAQDEVQFEIEESFLTFWNTLLQRNAITSRAIAAQTEFDRAHTQDAVGFFSISNWKEAISQFEQERSIVDQYQDRLFVTQSSLEKAASLKVKDPPNDQTTAAYVEKNIKEAQQYTEIEYFINQAKIHRKELQIIDEEILREQYNAELFARSYLPEFSFFAEIFNGTFIAFITGDQVTTFWEAGIQLEWKFDGLANAHRSVAADDQRLQRIVAKKSTWDNILLEVQTNFGELQELLKELHATQAQYESAHVAYQTDTTRLEIGELSPVDFARSEQLWQQAQFDLADVKIRTAIKYRQLLFACGYPTQCVYDYKPRHRDYSF